MRARLFLNVLGVEARKLMSYRVDFWLNALFAFVVELGVAAFLWRAVFDASGRERIGGFTFEGMVIYYLLAILLGRLARGQEHEVTVASDIYEGTLTRYLLYPAPYFGFKYAEHLGALVPALIQLAVFCPLVLLLIDVPAELTITPGSVLMAVVVVAVANLLAMLMLYPIQGIAFWADNVWSLNVMQRFVGELLGGLMLPLTLFPEAMQDVLALLPFQYLYYFPVLTLMGQVSVGEWLRGLAVMTLWCVVLFLLARRVWRNGYRVYSGVGI